MPGYKLRHLTPITQNLWRPVGDDFADGYPLDEKWNGYVHNDDRVLQKVIHYSSPTFAGAECVDPDCFWVEQWVHRAGPRENIFFKSEEVSAAIVTFGGLCPGLNDVIRQIVITLEIYGIKKITRIPFNYRGFLYDGFPEMPLSRKVVQNIHLSGGSFLGVSCGGPKVEGIVNNMQRRGINMLFVLGGNGTQAGADAIHNECRKQGIRVAVVGVPKTIDNDILLMDKAFGFDTAMEEAQRAINSAYIEVPFHLHGPHGVLRHLKYLFETKRSAVVCVAEGARQNFLESINATDASGNIILGDIGVHIQQGTKKYFKDIGLPADVKYIDPTYMIRACRANASTLFLDKMQFMVHLLDIVASRWAYVILTMYTYQFLKSFLTQGAWIPTVCMWHRCLTLTGQPDFI